MEDMSDRPRSAAVLAVIVFLEAIALVGVAIWSVATVIGTEARELTAGLFWAACLALIAFFLLQAGRGVLDGRSWSRSAVVVWQVLQIGVSFGTYNGAEGPVPLALAMFVPALVALVLVFRKPVRDWLSRERQERLADEAGG
jgi:peptidoglycan/LPS O-acetylase OafA/YrhL